MKSSVERLRWVLAGAAVLLLIVLAVSVGYGHYRQLRKWQRTLARLGLHGPHETDNFTYSSSPGDRTSYKLHAAKVIEHGDGKWSLYDVAVTLYSKTSKDEDHIYGSDIEYDDKTGVATAVGEVLMDLQVPGVVARAGGATPMPAVNGGAQGDRTIHVRTSGLVYVRKLAVAATDQQVEFRYAGLECTSKGAEFDSGGSMLHLLADVVMTGDVRHAPMTVHAVKADLNRQDNTVSLVRPVAESEGRTVTAASSVLHLRKDGSLEQAEGSGGVTLDEGTRHVAAAGFEGTFGPTSLPVNAKLAGGVTVTDSSALRPLKADAQEVDASFDALGNPVTVLAAGEAQVAFRDRKPGVPDLAREMRGDRILATFRSFPLEGAKSGHKAVSKLSEVEATGSAAASGYSLTTVAGSHAAAMKFTKVSADDLRAVFDANAVKDSQLRQVFGTGHTRLEQDAPQGEQQTSSGQTLEVEFVPVAAGHSDGLQIASAVQTGNVAIHSVPAVKPGAKAAEPSDASAARAVYDEASSKLTLTGGARYTQGETTLMAATIAVNQKTGDAEANGNVQATMASEPGTTRAPGAAGPQMTHVMADRATMVHATQVAEFFGSEAHPARLWQGASQVQAASLLFDQKRRSLTARPAGAGGVVHAVFADMSAGKNPAVKRPARGANLGQGDDQVVRVVSAAMDYSDLDREAVFTGGVRMDGTTGQARSQRAEVYLNPAQTGAGKTSAEQPTPFGGSIRKIVLTGDVRLEEPGRTGTGEQLVYTAADSSYVLTGTATKPPHVVDAQQGNVVGAILEFHAGDSTIVVSGTPGTKQAKPGRVRTETEVKQ